MINEYEIFEDTINRYRNSIERMVDLNMHSSEYINNFSGARLKLFIGDGVINDIQLDIETTGLSKTNNRITCISLLLDMLDGEQKIIQMINSDRISNLSIWDGSYPICLVRLDEISFDYVFNNLIPEITFHTYNGKTFDVPFISAKFENFDYSSHVDMRYLLANCKNKLRGGQKSIEKQLGFSRNDMECGDGKDAIRLFKKFDLSNDKDAFLDFMVYAFADVEGLRLITNWYKDTYGW